MKGKIIQQNKKYSDLVEKQVLDKSAILGVIPNPNNTILELEKIELLSFQEIIDQFPWYIIIVDEDHTIIKANRVIYDNFGFSEEEIIGTSCPKTIHNIDGEFPGCPLPEALKTGLPSISENYIPEMKKWFSSEIFPMNYSLNKKRLYLHFVRDITLLKEAELSIKQERAKSSFYLDLLRHDVGNIHQGILGNIQLAISKSEDQTNGCLNNALISLKRAQRLVKNVDTLTSLDTNEVKVSYESIFNIIQAIADEVKNSNPGREINIIINDCHPGKEVLGSELVTEFFFNILDNAIKHSHRAIIKINIDIIKNEKSELMVKIIDNGPGFPEQVRIMVNENESYYNDLDYHRTGVGLTLCVEISKLIGFTFRLEERDDNENGSQVSIIWK